MKVHISVLFSVFAFLMVISVSCSEAQNDHHRDTDNSEETNIQIPEKDFSYFLSKLASLTDTGNIRRFEKEIILFEKEDSAKSFPEKATLFVGSSSLRKWHSIEQDLAPHTVINRGFGGSTLAEAIRYFPRIIEKYKPKAIVLYEGDNDLSAGKMEPNTFLELFRLFTELCHYYLPETEIYFLSIKPSPARMGSWNKMNEGNRLIKEETRKHEHLYYIDVSSPMFDENGTPNPEFFIRDRLHLNQAGYQLWTEIIRQSLWEK